MLQGHEKSCEEPSNVPELANNFSHSVRDTLVNNDITKFFPIFHAPPSPSKEELT